MTNHEKYIAIAQAVIDQVIEIADLSPLLTVEEKLVFIYEMRIALNNAEEKLRSNPDWPFHANGHEYRLKQLNTEFQQKYDSFCKEEPSE